MAKLENREEVVNKLIQCFEESKIKTPNKEGFVTYDKFDEEEDQFYFAFAKRGYLILEIHCCPWGFQHATCGLKIEQHGRADLYFKDGIKSPAFTYVDVTPTFIMYLEALKEFIETHEDQVRERMEQLFNEEE